MKAVVYNKRALPDKLNLEEVAKPVPDDDQLLIKIVSVSVNAADYRSMRMGLIPKSKIFGADIAGRVETAGKNIIKFKAGDEVIGDLAGYGFGGFAEFALAPEKALVFKPEKLSFESAAALPMAGVTALQALRNKGNIKAGQKVLIVGGGGGVGTFSIQLAKYFGAEVTAVCSTKNVDQSASLGADYTIDYSKEDFTRTRNRYDLILAVNGNTSLLTYKRLLKPSGRYVMVGGAISQILKSLLFGKFLSFGSRKMLSLAAKASQKDLELIAQLAEEGKIKSVIDRHYPLEKTNEAFKYLMEGHAGGKVLINVE